MSTEKRLIDANELLNTLRKRTLLAYPNEFYGLMLAHDLIDNALTVDAAEVVRCKDCYHNEQCICVCCEDGEMIKCGLHHKHMDANGYCHDGRRC